MDARQKAEVVRDFLAWREESGIESTLDESVDVWEGVLLAAERERVLRELVEELRTDPPSVDDVVKRIEDLFQ